MTSFHLEIWQKQTSNVEKSKEMYKWLENTDKDGDKEELIQIM